MTNTIKINSKRTKIIAHRGVSGLECKNTNAAFIAAGNRSYFGIETDVHVTADEKFAIIHDDNTKRVSNIDMDIHHESVTKKLVKKLHKNGIEINCWTVDVKETAEKLIDYGIDYSTSNILE